MKNSVEVIILRRNIVFLVMKSFLENKNFEYILESNIFFVFSFILGNIFEIIRNLY